MHAESSGGASQSLAQTVASALTMPLYEHVTIRMAALTMPTSTFLLMHGAEVVDYADLLTL